MFERRDVLKFALGSFAIQQTVERVSSRTDGFDNLFGLIQQASAQDGTPGFPMADATPFDPGMVTDTARTLATQPYKAPNASLPESLRNLNYEQYVAIKAKPSATLWAAENLGFAIIPLHRGFIFSGPMTINIVDQGQARRIVYDQLQFDFAKLAVPPDLGDIGFSGFRVLTPQGKDLFAELAVFQGASFFRATARGQTPGTMARALSIKTGDPRGEEFPAFRTVWIEKPNLSVDALVVHAVIDSESLTGAYRFTIHPGDTVIIDTECTLFARTNVDHFGLATMSATHLLGPIDRRKSDDLRPTVSEIGGLQMLTGSGEWLWRPVANRETLQISTFVDDKPRGFGLIQRDRDFENYQDDDQHWEQRPSLWIEPIGDWSSGGMQLLEIPNESEANDNIIAYWRPKLVLTPGNETAFAYRQFWCWSPPEAPPLAITTQSYSGKGPGTRRRRFIVEFMGDILADPKNADIKPALSLAPGTVASMRTFRSKDLKTYRVLFDLDPGSDTSSEMRLVLEAANKPVSETWLYRWTP